MHTCVHVFLCPQCHCRAQRTAAGVSTMWAPVTHARPSSFSASAFTCWTIFPVLGLSVVQLRLTPCSHHTALFQDTPLTLKVLSPSLWKPLTLSAGPCPSDPEFALHPRARHSQNLQAHSPFQWAYSQEDGPGMGLLRCVKDPSHLPSSHHHPFLSSPPSLSLTGLKLLLRKAHSRVPDSVIHRVQLL